MNDRKSSMMTRRQAVTTTLGVASVAAIGATQVLAQPVARRPLEGKRVLVAVGDFSENLETYYMVYRLMEEGVVPVVAAIEVKRLHMVVHDFDPNHSNYVEMAGHCIQTDIAYKDVKPDRDRDRNRPTRAYQRVAASAEYRRDGRFSARPPRWWLVRL